MLIYDQEAIYTFRHNIYNNWEKFGSKSVGVSTKNVELDTNVHSVPPPFPLRNLIVNCCRDIFANSLS